MVSAAHTPGPWVYRHSRKDGDIGILADGCCLAETFSEIRRANEGAFEEQEANARLIAAAPDLLEALERALNFIANTEGEMGEQLECGDMARAAIAKAKGEKA